MKTRLFLLVLLLVTSLAPHAIGQSLAEGSRSLILPSSPPGVNCSPAPCVLPPTQASEGGFEAIDAPIAADPLNPKHLLLGSEDFNCGQSSFSGFHFSPDGGSTWDVHCMFEINTAQRQYIPGGEPMVGYDSSGVAYIGDGYADTEGQHYGLVALEKSSDGLDWSDPKIALGSPNNHSLFFYSALAVDASPQSPYVNNLYVSAVVLNEPRQNKNQVVVAHSSDGGTTWKAVNVAPVQISPAADEFTVLAIGKDGTVYLTWLYCPGSGSDAGCRNSQAYMVFSKSTDGGNTWSTPRSMVKVTMPLDSTLPNTTVAVDNYPAVSADNSNGPHAGNLYVVMYNWTGTYLQVQVIHSTDGGNTWSKPVPVAPASANHDQFFPWLSVSSTGLVGVSWLDRRNDPANVNYQAFAAISGDGGHTFPSNVQLTTAFSNPNDNLGNIGPHVGNTWAGPDFIAAWIDDSNSQFLQDVVGGIRLH